MATPTSNAPQLDLSNQAEFAGHPTGLFMLFFAEMWERFSYYGMRALLVLYIIKGFLSRSDGEAYAIYGAYAGMVYATPFIGGMLADKVLGSRRAVILGGVLMAAGHLLMTLESEIPFFGALALLIVGNGFFKPNISTIVGSLYPDGSPKKDAGFTIFYIGINLGAAAAPLICGYVGETYGWHYGFGLATIGMLVGLAVFVMPSKLTRIVIFLTAVLSGLGMIYTQLDKSIYELGAMGFVALFLMAAGVVAFLAIGKGGLPEGAGEPADPEAPHRKVMGIQAQHLIYIGSFLVVPVIAGLMLMDGQFGEITTVPVLGIELRLIGIVMLLVGGLGFGAIVWETVKATRIEAQRMVVVMVLMFFSMLFWAFFEQAGSSINLFTDRNVDRVFETEIVSADQVGQTIPVDVTQELNGRTMGDKTVVTMADIDSWRASIGGFGLALSFDADREDWAKKDGHADPLLGYAVVVDALVPGSAAATAMMEVLIPAEPQPERTITAPVNADDAPARVDDEVANPTLEGDSDDADVPPELVMEKTLVPLQVGHVLVGLQAGNTALVDLAGMSLEEVKELFENQNGEVMLTAQAIDISRDEKAAITGVQASGERLEFSLERAADHSLVVDWPVSEDDVGMGTAGSEVATSAFQAANPVYIMIFGLVFSALWTFLGKRGWEPSTPVKFAMGIGQLALGFGALWYGAAACNDFGIVSMSYLMVAYLLITTGELCLSPVGLSMVTKLSPKRIVSMVMGAWFLATAFSNYLSAIIAQFTGVGHGGGDADVLPPPIETVGVYGEVFGIIAVTAGVSAVIVLVLSPFLTKWMHEGVDESQEAAG